MRSVRTRISGLAHSNQAPNSGETHRSLAAFWLSVRKGEQEVDEVGDPLCSPYPTPTLSPQLLLQGIRSCSRTIHLEEPSELRLGQRTWRILSYSRSERRTPQWVGDAPSRTLAPRTRPLSYASAQGSGSPIRQMGGLQDRTNSMTTALHSDCALNDIFETFIRSHS